MTEAAPVCTACIGEPAAAAAGPAGPGPQLLPYEVDVSAVGLGLKTELQAGEHAFVLDAGRGLGGAQSAASPVQAFIGSIVACTQITLQLVAAGEGVELPEIEWKGWGVFDAQRLVSGSDTHPRFQSIKVHGNVSGGSASKDTLDKLAVLTAARCPISQSLHPDVKYELSLERQEEQEA